jgi:hypothetical protein
MPGKAAWSPAYWRYAGDRERSQAPAGRANAKRLRTWGTRRNCCTTASELPTRPAPGPLPQLFPDELQSLAGR